MVIRYGVISDIHEDPRVVVPALEVLKDEGVDKLIVNGDIGGNYGSLEKSQQYTGFLLEQVAKSGLESFVQPGSHETLLGYGPVIEHFSDKYSNVVDVTKTPKVEEDGHSLVFLPGSDFLSGGEYQIGNGKIPSGRFFKNGDSLVKFDNLDQYVGAINQKIVDHAFQYSNMGDLKDLVTVPEKTVVVCHVPRKFDNPDVGVDMAEFGLAMNDFNLNGQDVKKDSVFPLPVAQQIVKTGAPVEIRKENRGNEDLKEIYEEIGVKKAVSAHFHESSHRAHDSSGNSVLEDTFVDDLFWNAGHGDAGRVGVLTVDGEKVSYRNVCFG